MPRIALVCLCLVGACSFDADYSDGTYFCSDNKCPLDLECRLDFETPQCREKRRDAAIDSPPGDGMPDGPPPALTCVEPGMLVDGVAVTGTTVGRLNLMGSFCAGGLQNANDAVYEIRTTAVNQQLKVSITGSLTAYVLNACMQAPNTAACLGGKVAAQGNPISVAAAAVGKYWVVVDNNTVSVMGEYTLRVDVD